MVVAQLVERLLLISVVRSSNPVIGKCYNEQKAGDDPFFKKQLFLWIIYGTSFKGLLMNKHGSPGLVVMGVDLLSRGHEFESQHGIFQLIRCYNCVPTVV